MKRVLSVIKRGLLSLAIFFISTSPFFSNNSNKLKVGYFNDTPYLMDINEKTGYKSGYGYDYLQMISNYTGWEYEYVVGEWYTLWNMFLTGEIDLLEDVSYVPERESQMLFPDTAMGSETYRLYVYNKNSEINAEHINQTLQGKKIGITAGTIQVELFKNWTNKRNIKCEIIPFQSDFERNEKLACDYIDGVVELEASSLNEWEPIIEIGSTNYYLALSKGNEKHLRELNQALERIQEVDPNFTNILYYNYYSRSVVSSRLSSAEANWLNNTQILRCGYYEDLISNSPEKPGILKNIMEEYLRVLNIENLKVEYTYYSSFEKLAEALQEDKIDIGYPFSEYSGASEIGNYSIVTNIATLPISIITKKSNNFGKLEKIGIPGNGIGLYHAKSNFPDSEIVCFSDLNKLLDSVANNELNAAIIPEQLLTPATLTHKRYADLQVAQIKNPYTNSIAVKRGNTALYQLLKRGNSLVDSSFIKDAVASSLRYEVDYSFKTFVTNHILFVIFIIIFIFGILILLHLAVYKRRTLQKNYNSERSLRNELAQALKVSEEHQKKERELLYLSETDKLTGIANRGAEGKIKQFMEIGTLGMFCLFDVDKFKSINDNYGHLTGDKVLIAIADCMKKVFRETDIILRLGGDEFAAFTIGITEKEIATNLINRFFAEIDQINIPELEGTKISVSLGATFILSNNALDFETAYKRADKGCYISKREEGNYFTFIEN